MNQLIGGGNFPIHRFHVYTPLQLQEALVRNNNLREIRDDLKRTYSNPTAQYLDELFDDYA